MLLIGVLVVARLAGEEVRHRLIGRARLHLAIERCNKRQEITVHKTQKNKQNRKQNRNRNRNKIEIEIEEREEKRREEKKREGKRKQE
jgi:hypothetical protein